MRQFHAHIYFEDAEIAAIYELRDKALQSPLRFWKLFEKRVGPHARPMLELHFDETKYSESLAWLEKHHAQFSVLVHEDTGDDVKDHEQAIWFGPKLPIHFEFFDEVRKDESLAVHAKN